MNKISSVGFQIIFNHLPKTVECGLHSGYPPCCIAFYIVRLLTHSLRQKRNLIEKLSNTKFKGRYIPCPDCLIKNKPVKFKGCNCNHAAECAE